MAKRPAGFDIQDYEPAVEALLAASSELDVTRTIETHPVAASPILHALLIGSIEDARAEDRELRQEQVDRIFRLLHERAHSPSIGQRGERRSGSPEARIPTYFAEILVQLGHRLPARVDRPLDPRDDQDEVARTLAFLNEGSVALPAYAESVGARWSLVVVVCTACGAERVLPHAHFVNVPECDSPSVAAMAVGLGSLCRCGAEEYRPSFVWIREPPGALDLLNSVAAVWRVQPDTHIYRPPHGTLPNPINDRIVEARADRLVRELDADPGRQGRKRYLAIAYSAAELRGILEMIETVADDEPLAMRGMILEYARRLQHGQASPTSVAGVLERAAPSVFDGWPVVVASMARRDQPYTYLAERLVAEACARAHECPGGIRARLAGQTAQALILLNEPALAEVAFTRAADLYENMPAGPERDEVTLNLRSLRAELHTAFGEDEAAGELRGEALDAESAETTALARIRRLQIRGGRALSLHRTGELADSFTEFVAATTSLDNILANTDANADSTGLTRLIRTSLSAALANWSGLITELADYLELAELAVGRGSSEPAGSEFPQRVRDVAMRVAEPRQPEKVVAAMRRLVRLLWTRSEPVSPASARAFARTMLERALRMSTEDEVSDLIAPQSARLAGMHVAAGNFDAAGDAMRASLAAATSVGDHAQIGHAHIYFANQAGRAKRGAEALRHLRAAAGAMMRHTIGRGHHEREGEECIVLAGGALQCARFGGDALDAIVIAESLKDVALGVILRMRGALASSPPRAVRDDTLNQDFLDRERRLRDPVYAEWCDATTLDVACTATFLRHLNTLGHRTTYVGFLRGFDCVWVYAAWPGGATVFKQARPIRVQADQRDGPPPPPASSSDLGEQPPATPSDNEPNLDEDQLALWGRVLLAPIAARLRELTPDDTLIISPDGGLENLPFAALPFEGRRLCEVARLSVTTGIGAFDVSVRRPNAPPSSVFCVGDPRRPGERRLRGARREAREIVALFRHAGRVGESRVGRDATLRCVAEAVRTASVVHFACHADRRGAGGVPRLLLAAQQEDNGDLVADRVVGELELVSGAFINLSACSSAGPADSVGPSVRGLVPAFLVAGAASVVAALWDLHDEPVAIFNGEFYRCLLQGMTPAAALASVQRSCIVGGLGNVLTAPSIWAAFVHFGK